MQRRAWLDQTASRLDQPVCRLEFKTFEVDQSSSRLEEHLSKLDQRVSRVTQSLSPLDLAAEAAGRRPFFTDATIPASAAADGSQYIVQGFRGTRAGMPSDAMVVQFGFGGSGAFVSSANGLKMAA
ncbi:hypothetical protein BH11PLA1_BH11PLA1_10320 [soil metagenome]